MIQITIDLRFKVELNYLFEFNVLDIVIRKRCFLKVFIFISSHDHAILCCEVEMQNLGE